MSIKQRYCMSLLRRCRTKLRYLPVRAGESAEDEAGGIREVELRIPNREIAVIFQRSVVDHFNRRVGS